MNPEPLEICLDKVAGNEFFDEIRVGRFTRISFHRTLRIPEDGRDYPLPAGLGRFPIHRVEDYAEKVPVKWLKEGEFFIPLFVLVLLFLLRPTPSITPILHAVEDQPIVGAIRWDGWYGEGGVTKELETSLGQKKYHFRLPWFARIINENKVIINGDSQAIVEQEITYAAQAGLNYWAFVDYANESPAMHTAMNRYLAAKDKKGIQYCFVEEGARVDRIGNAGWKRLVEHFRHPDYQTVLDGRPLLFLYVKTLKLGKADWDELKRQTLEACMKAPYLVLMGWDPVQDAKDMTALGFDAISAYARGGSYSMTQPSYAEQSALIRRDRWEKSRALGAPTVTFASAGWDTRPRNERPPSWCKDWVGAASPDLTPPAQQKPLIDSVTATPDELAAHIREALAWTKANRDLNPSNAVIIYGWNENDEGGWLQPTLGADGKPDDARIKALQKVMPPA